MKFDYTLNIGNLLEIFGIIFALITFSATLARRIERIETKVDLIYDWFSENIINSARHHKGAPLD